MQSPLFSPPPSTSILAIDFHCNHHPCRDLHTRRQSPSWPTTGRYCFTVNLHWSCCHYRPPSPSVSICWSRIVAAQSHAFAITMFFIIAKSKVTQILAFMVWFVIFYLSKIYCFHYITLVLRVLYPSLFVCTENLGI